MSGIIPTAEEAASAAAGLRAWRAFVDDRADHTDLATFDADIVLPLLDAIAAGRVFGVRPERCAMCRGRGHSSFQDDGVMVTHDCGRCEGSGYEPAPPGRKQRTAYDAMIDGATADGDT